MTKLASFRLAGVFLAAVSASFLASAPAQAGSANGTIAVALNVTSACVVNGATAYSGSLGQVGKIQFADQPGLFGNTDAAAVATGGSSAITVQCSPGSSPTMVVGAGLNDTGGVHYMSSGTGTVGYHLYSDNARTNEIAIGQTLSLSGAAGAALSVPIYARTTSNGSLVAAGTYTDAVQVTLNF
jgi:spore coat protein U-like protein